MFDHSNCGIGAIANLDGAYSHEIIEQGMTLLKALSHRGGTSKDGTGDGCGILLQIPKHFYHKKYGISGPFAVMMAFLPKEIEDRKVAVDIIYEAVHHFNMKVIKEIEVPVDSTFLTPTAKKTEPIPTQFIFDMTNYDVDVAKGEKVIKTYTWKLRDVNTEYVYISFSRMTDENKEFKVKVNR